MPPYLAMNWNLLFILQLSWTSFSIVAASHVQTWKDKIWYQILQRKNPDVKISYHDPNFLYRLVFVLLLTTCSK